MKLSNTRLTFLVLITFILTCSFASKPNAPSTIVFVGSTPGDELIKSLLTIPAANEVDFIRWNLTLSDSKSNQNTFTLNIGFGVAQPNTLGFKVEEKRTFEGTYRVAQSKNDILHGVIYYFKSSALPSEIMMVKLNENILHLLTPQHHLMNGNGGWSYSLNRKEFIQDNTVAPALTSATRLLTITSDQLIYDGRTPCQEIAEDYNLEVSSACFKLKWRLILNRDPITHQPTTYTIRKVVDNMPRDVSGKWTIIKGIKENSDVIIYQLDPEDPENAISLLAGDENVLFFLDKKNRLFTGNSDFSFALNKKL
jgi:hypothetical protein